MTAWSVQKRKRWARAVTIIWVAVAISVYLTGDPWGIGSTLLNVLVAGAGVMAVLLLLSLAGRRWGKT